MLCYMSAIPGKIQKFEGVSAGNISREEGTTEPTLLPSKTNTLLSAVEEINTSAV